MLDGDLIIPAPGVPSGRWVRIETRKIRTVKWLERRLRYPGGKKWRAAVKAARRDPFLQCYVLNPAIARGSR